jgi:hypothetical protein
MQFPGENQFSRYGLVRYSAEQSRAAVRRSAPPRARGADRAQDEQDEQDEKRSIFDDAVAEPRHL